MARRLSQTAINELRPDPHRRLEMPTGTAPGMALRIATDGSKVYTLRYRFNGRQPRIILGEHPDVTLAVATERAHDVIDQIDQGFDPLAPPEPLPVLTVARAAEEWIKRDQAKNRSLREMQRVLDRDILPAIGERPMAEVSKRELVEMLDVIADRAPVLAVRIRAHTRRLFRWCAQRDLIPHDVSASLPLGVVEARDRYLSDEELALVWRAVGEIERPLFASAVHFPCGHRMPARGDPGRDVGGA